MQAISLETILSKTIQPGTERTGAYLPLLPGQTVCTVKNEKGEKCTGHVKQWQTAPRDVIEKAAPGNILHRCQRCYAIYEGPPQQYLNPKIKK
ncbi:MAG TPA: hypothetical protein VNN73_04275 [Blastocatellia bacterium]|nr:hypothetical protein [Blastocatellia bacterium]